MWSHTRTVKLATPTDYSRAVNGYTTGGKKVSDLRENAACDERPCVSRCRKDNIT